jgi:putative FmdB family regulatory protein
MPTYEYRCEKGHTFEALQRMTEDALETCEKCDAPAVRVLHAPAVHFKGSGFYNTDYGTKKRSREKAAESKSGESKSGESKSGESKSGESSGDSAKPADAKPASSEKKKSESSAA